MVFKSILRRVSGYSRVSTSLDGSPDHSKSRYQSIPLMIFGIVFTMVLIGFLGGFMSSKHETPPIDHPVLRDSPFDTSFEFDNVGAVPSAKTRGVRVIIDHDVHLLSLSNEEISKTIAFLLEPHGNPSYRVSRVFWEFQLDSFELSLVSHAQKVFEVLKRLHAIDITVEVLFRVPSSRTSDESFPFDVSAAAIAIKGFKVGEESIDGMQIEITDGESISWDSLKSALEKAKAVSDDFLHSFSVSNSVFLQNDVMMRDIAASTFIDYLGVVLDTGDYSKIRSQILRAESLLGSSFPLLYTVDLPTSFFSDHGYVVMEETLRALMKELKFDHSFGGFAVGPLKAYEQLGFCAEESELALPSSFPISSDFKPKCKRFEGKLFVYGYPEGIECILRMDTLDEAVMSEGTSEFEGISDSLPEIEMFSTKLAKGVCVDRIGPPIHCFDESEDPESSSSRLPSAISPLKIVPSFTTKGLYLWPSASLDLLRASDSQLDEFVQFLSDPTESNFEFNRLFWDIGDNTFNLFQENKKRIAQVIKMLHLRGVVVDLVVKFVIDENTFDEDMSSDLAKTCEELASLPISIERFDGIMLDISPSTITGSPWFSTAKSTPEAWWKLDDVQSDAFNDAWKDKWIQTVKSCKDLTNPTGIALSTVFNRVDHITVSEVFHAIDRFELADFLVVRNFYDNTNDFSFGSVEEPRGGVQNILSVSSLPVVFMAEMLPPPYGNTDETLFSEGKAGVEELFDEVEETFMFNHNFAGLVLHDYPSYKTAP